MSIIERSNLLVIALLVSTTPLISLGIGPTAIPSIRLLGTIILLQLVPLAILIISASIQRLLAFASINIPCLIWTLLAFYFPLRDISSPYLTFSERGLALAFSILPLSSVILMLSLERCSFVRDKHVCLFLLPIIFLSPFVFLRSSYDLMSWLSLSFAFFPVPYLFFTSPRFLGMVLPLSRFLLILSTSVFMISLIVYAINVASRTLLFSSLFFSFFLVLFLVNRFIKQKYRLMVSLFLGIAFGVLASVFGLFQSVNEKSDSILNSRSLALDSQYTSSFLANLFSTLGIGDTRSFVYYDLFSRNSYDLFFGSPGKLLFSFTLDGGTERGGVEGFFANIILEYGVIAALILLSFIVYFLISSTIFSLRSTSYSPTCGRSCSLSFLLFGKMAILIIAPLFFFSLSFYNPTPSLAHLYLFVALPFFLKNKRFLLC